MAEVIAFPLHPRSRQVEILRCRVRRLRHRVRLAKTLEDLDKLASLLVDLSTQLVPRDVARSTQRLRAPRSAQLPGPNSAL